MGGMPVFHSVIAIAIFISAHTPPRRPAMALWVAVAVWLLVLGHAPVMGASGGAPQPSPPHWEGPGSEGMEAEPLAAVPGAPHWRGPWDQHLHAYTLNPAAATTAACGTAVNSQGAPALGRPKLPPSLCIEVCASLSVDCPWKTARCQVHRNAY